MYNAEVLSKFPVVQHFPFGSLFSWERDPNAVLPPYAVHTASGPQTRPVEPNSGTQAPWANSGANVQAIPPIGATAAPWAGARRDGMATSIPGANRVPSALPDTSRMPPGPMAPTRAPWSAQPRPSPPQGGNADMHIKAPWAK